MQLTDRATLVTGGAAGIGRAIATAFAAEGADVAIGDVREEPKDDAESLTTAELVREQGREALFRETDVTDADEVEALVEAAVDAFGGLDVLVNNAGISLSGTVEDLDEAEWEAVIDVNLTGVYRCCKAALPHLADSPTGRIVNVSSQHGLVGFPESAAYCASKGGVANLTRQMALDYADAGVTVNAVCPGPIKTQMTDVGEEAEPWYEDDDERERYEGMIPLGFMGDPEDVAHAAVFAASDGARFMTGHNLVVDGGYVAK